MKKIKFSTLLFLILISTLGALAQSSSNCYTNLFNATATSRSNKTAYLLMYLSSATYADIIPVLDNRNISNEDLDKEGKKLQQNENAFKTKFKKVMGPLMFANANEIETNMEYFDQPPSIRDFDGYDPECIVVNTENVIYVSWRGTDRVQNASNSIGYEIREWYGTDFQAIPYNPGNGIVGTVHKGAWMSMMKIANRVAEKIANWQRGNNKKVWITGHSLGAGQAQLFAAYLAKKHNIKAQGVWTFATPQFGDKAFMDDLETMLGTKTKVQRFEFIDDPIATIAQVLPFLKPGGIRNHYTDIATLNFNTDERGAGEVARIAASTPTALFGLLPGKVGSGGFCFHHQHWYLLSAYNQLRTEEKKLMPLPLPMREIKNGDFCSGIDITRAENSKGATLIEGGLQVLDGVATIPAKAAEITVDLAAAAFKKGKELVFGVGNFIENASKWVIIKGMNASHAALEKGAGTYRIKNFAANRNLAIDGNCYGNNNCGVVLWDENGYNTKFRITENGTAYKIQALNNNTVLEVPSSSKVNGTRLKMYDWQDNLVKPGNQQWYFIRVDGKPNQYIIMNYESEKVLDAHANQLDRNGCEIMQYDPTGNGNQIWILEKVN